MSSIPVAKFAVGAALGIGGGIATSIWYNRTDRASEQRTYQPQADRLRGEWTAWKAKLDAEFPTRQLDSPADHARLDRFLAANPAPGWVSVRHENFNRISIAANPWPEKLPSEHTKVNVGAIALGIAGAVAVTGALTIGMMGKLGPVAQAAAGAAFLTGAFGMGVPLLNSADSPPSQISEVTREVNAGEWQGPGHTGLGG